MIYLDNAATSFPKPKSVEREVLRCIRDYCGNPGRGAHPLALAAEEAIYSCRCTLADFFSAERPEHFVFVPNATAALNLAIKSKVRQGQRILISDIEHNAVRRPVHKLHADGVCEYELFDTSGDDEAILQSIEKCARGGADMLICTHVSNVSGRILPINKIGNLCKKRGIYFIIDASQSAGHIKIDFSKLDFDVFCAPGHKGLFGIQGSGFAYFRKAEALETLFEGGSGYDSSNLFMPIELPERLEAGTLSTPSIVSLDAGVRFLSEVGINEISRIESARSRRCLEILSSFDQNKVYTEGGGDFCSCGPVSFNNKKFDSEHLAAALADCGVCVRAGLHCAPLAHNKLGTAPLGSVRVSPGYFTSDAELDAFYGILKRILK